MEIYKPTPDDFQPLIEISTHDTGKEAWRERMLTAITSVLKKNPLRYRAYGPYWWPLKKMLIGHDGWPFGDFIDAEWLELMDYGDPTVNLIAAYAYEDVQFNLGLMLNSEHSVDTVEGETFDYVLIDPDMEGGPRG